MSSKYGDIPFDISDISLNCSLLILGLIRSSLRYFSIFSAWTLFSAANCSIEAVSFSPFKRAFSAFWWYVFKFSFSIFIVSAIFSQPSGFSLFIKSSSFSIERFSSDLCLLGLIEFTILLNAVLLLLFLFIRFCKNSWLSLNAGSRTFELPFKTFAALAGFLPMLYASTPTISASVRIDIPIAAFFALLFLLFISTLSFSCLGKAIVCFWWVVVSQQYWVGPTLIIPLKFPFVNL